MAGFRKDVSPCKNSRIASFTTGTKKTKQDKSINQFWGKEQ